MKLFKSLLVALFFLFTPAIVFAQGHLFDKGAEPESKPEPCKFDVNRYDPFTKEYVRAAEHRIGQPSWDWSFTIEQSGQRYFIGVHMLLYGHRDDLFAKGQKVLIRLKNDKIIELVADKDFTPITAKKAGFSTTGTNYLPKFVVTRQTVIDLSESPITDIKATVGPQELVLPKITEKQTKKIMESANCLLTDIKY